MKDQWASIPALAQEALGRSDAFLAFQERLSRAARVDRPVLLVGERGTGKELAAARLHYLSPRWQGPFLALNCSALAENLVESELFGHEAGAFTGAARRRAGRFEAADNGTLFLDELGTMPLAVQEKLLRVVEYGVFERVGATEAVQVDVRVVGATSADLPGLAAQGKFKADLLDRLAFEVLVLPPLRDRGEDILLLAEHFAGRMAGEMGIDPPTISEAARARLLGYPWPGNVRELRNVVERAVCRSEGRIEDWEFDPFAAVKKAEERRQGAPQCAPTAATFAGYRADVRLVEVLAGRPLLEAVAEFESEALRMALERTRYNQRAAAELLGLSYHQFRGMFRKYGNGLAKQ